MTSTLDYGRPELRTYRGRLVALRIAAAMAALSAIAAPALVSHLGWGPTACLPEDMSLPRR